ncbi:hypothetical protein N657DRAFT_651200 [Parathielavia appendiculata]|uniref:Zn(2)-C6 fungal-type domain-containing protein n=1 Tax=Parathielavia appendiculata TaxID=2587402 RepID=A0AAN6TPW2_9PEZI|nr:hypothetical protein N657DRAFT_651200 [Parathielavia appendiculata]
MPDAKGPNVQPSPDGLSTESRRRRPVPGRGHCKSRKGCFNCKRRRVKCSEELPSCRGCRRLGLECQYPGELPRLALKPAQNPNATPSTLRLEDLRFFYHFLSAAYPSLPFGLHDVWQTVAAMSHEYDFLAHAVLGLAAQHLTACTASDFSVPALSHRVSAITALNGALSEPCASREDADARFAAAILLTFQSSYMPDAMMDFIGMLRGWMVIQTTVVPSMGESIFHDITEETYVGSMKKLLQLNPVADLEIGAGTELQDILEGFLASLRLLAPLCRSTAELHYLASMERIARMSEASPVHACLELVPLYAATNEMDSDEFASFTNPINYTAQILLVHFWMLTHVLQHHSLGAARSYVLKDEILFQWVETAAQKLPPSHKRYVLWPLGMASQGLFRRLNETLGSDGLDYRANRWHCG